MSNAQSIDSLRELNAKLLDEIAELRKKFAEIEGENAEIPELRRKVAEVEAENAKLRQIIEENARRDVRVKELEQKNTELEARLAIVEQSSVAVSKNDKEAIVKQSAPSSCIYSNVEIKVEAESTEKCFAEDSSSDDNLLSIPDYSQRKQDQSLPSCVSDQKSLVDREIDTFLDDAYKKSVSDGVRRHNKEKKLLRESAKNQIQAVTSVDSKLSRDKKTVTIGNDQDSKLSLSTGDDISASLSLINERVDTRVTQDNLSCDMETISCADSEDVPSDEMSGPIATQPLDRNQVTEQILKHDLSRPISSGASVELHDESILNNAIEGSTQRLAYWIDEAIRIGLKEILCLYHYSFEFEEKVKNITADGKTKDKTARSMIYKDMLQYLPNVTLGNLRIRTHRAKNILMLFGEKGVGIDRIRLVTCSASDISRLTNTQIQNIIDYVNDRVHKTVTIGNDQSHVFSKTVTIGNDLTSVTPQASVSSARTNPTIDRTNLLLHKVILS